MTELTKLDLSHNDPGAAGAASLVPSLLMMKKLTDIMLEPRYRGAEGATSLAPLLSIQSLHLKVSGSEGEILHVKIRKLTRLGKMMDAYCDRRNIDRECIAFYLMESESPRITDGDTALEIEEKTRLMRC